MEGKTISLQKVILDIYNFLKKEKDIYLSILIYSIGIGVLTLAVPISIQTLVNSVGFTSLLQPILVLSFILLIFLLFSGFLSALNIYMIEILQRKIYARVTEKISFNLLETSFEKMRTTYGADVASRYFEVMHIQKSITSFMTEGIAIFLQTILGLIILAFYHPYFLVFDFILIISLWLIWISFSRQALKTSLLESKAKYKVAGFFQDITRGALFFKSYKRKNFVLNKSNELMDTYLEKRNKHFQIVLTQSILLLFLYATMSALIIGIGGILVIQNQLSLGQLVAAEIIITGILVNISKLGKYLDIFYDLYTAIEKISIFDQEPCDSDNKNLDNKNNDLILENISIKDYFFNMNFKDNKKYLLYPKSYSATIVFLDLIRGLIVPQKGSLKIDDIHYNDLSLDKVRDFIYVVQQPLLFAGTLRSNLLLGLHNVSDSLIYEILDLVDLSAIIEKDANGLEQEILPNGYPL